jgi:hypothetical protein
MWIGTLKNSLIGNAVMIPIPGIGVAIEIIAYSVSVSSKASTMELEYALYKK